MKVNSLLRSRAIQWLRHAIRFAVLVFIFFAPILAHYRAYLANQQIEEIRAQEQASFSRSVILGVDGILRNPDAESPNAEGERLLAGLKNIRGNTWSADLYGISLVDPLAGAESISASRSVTTYLLLGLLIPVAATILFGRFFCSWICPAGLLFDLSDRIRRFLEHLKIPVRHVTLWRGNKYVLLVIGLLMAFLIGIPLLGYFYPPALVGREANAIVTSFFSDLLDSPAGAGVIVFSGAALFLFVVIVAEILVARRGWCRYVCPGGALYSLLGSKRIAQIRNDRARCTECTECIKVCPMGLNPMKNLTPGIECDQCLLCLGACPPHSLEMELSIPIISKKKPDSPTRPEPVAQS